MSVFKYHITVLFIITCAGTLMADNDSGPANRDSSSRFTIHFQTTAIDQYHGKFRSPYSGANSLMDTNEQDMSVTATLFMGMRLWRYGAFYCDPELAEGSGLSGARGLAGFTNAEVYRVGKPFTLPYIARAYYQQHIALPGSRDTMLADDVNQVAQPVPDRRLTFSAGKFSLADFFDRNPYANDPRSQFMNWVLMNNGAWDYPANTRGYDYGMVVQLIERRWYVQASGALEPYMANGPILDPNFTKTFGLTFESGCTYNIKGKQGGIALLLYLNQNRGGVYSEAVQMAQQGIPDALNVDNLTAYNGNKKYGIGINWNQKVSEYIALFARLGWNDGQNATWAYTPVDRTITPGVNIDGALWHRKTDNIGLACIVNGISANHIAFLNAGGYDFMIGDGKLTNYAPETIMECYYNWQFHPHLFLAPDFQYVINPAYNADRGPVAVYSLRVHAEF
ncbi:MAG: carbohydrate porin [Bacteroidia bacterium]|nr:carbohydrate porin [Bacteroidia bacterium]